MEKNYKWVGWLFKLLLAAVIVILVLKYNLKVPLKKTLGDYSDQAVTQVTGGNSGKGQITETLENFEHFKDGELTDLLGRLEAISKKRGRRVLGILHCHAPGNLESEQIATHLNRVAKNFGPQVQIYRADVVAYPDLARSENITKLPKVIMFIGNERVYSFQGLLPFPQINDKVQELLLRIARMDKNWRPEVKGMQRVSDVLPPTKTNLAKP